MKKQHICYVIVGIASTIIILAELMIIQEINLVRHLVEIIFVAIPGILGIIFEIIEDRNIKKQQDSQKAVLFQDLYDKFKQEYRPGIEDEIVAILSIIGKKSFENTLDMRIIDVDHYEKTIENENWQIEILCDQYEKNLTLYDKKNKNNYFYDSSDNYIEVKLNFLKFYRNQCKSNKIRIRK